MSQQKYHTTKLYSQKFEYTVVRLKTLSHKILFQKIYYFILRKQYGQSDRQTNAIHQMTVLTLLDYVHLQDIGNGHSQTYTYTYVLSVINILRNDWFS